MQIIHTGDWHFDEATHRRPGEGGINEGWHDVARAFDQMIDRAIAIAATGEQVVVAFTGDLSVNRKPTPQTYTHVIAGIAKLTERGIPIVAVPGNHDISSNSEANALQPLTAIKGFHLFNNPGIAWIYGEGASVRVRRSPRPELEGTPTAAIVLMPWVTRAAAQAQLPADVDQDDLLAQMGAAITAQIRHYVAEARAAAPTIPVFLAYHGTVSGAYTATGQPAHLFKEPLVSAIDVDGMGLAGAMYGHIHNRQEIGGTTPNSTPQIYSSSLERLTFGDERDTKGWVEWDVPTSSGTPAIYRYGDSSARRFLTIDLDELEIITDLTTGETTGIPDVDDAIVKVRATRAHADRLGLDERLIRKALLAAGAHAVPVIIIEREHEDVIHQAADLARTDPMIALAEYLRDEYPDEDETWHVQHLQLAEQVIAGGDPQSAYDAVWANAIAQTNDGQEQDVDVKVTIDNLTLNADTLPAAQEIMHGMLADQPLSTNL